LIEFNIVSLLLLKAGLIKALVVLRGISLVGLAGILVNFGDLVVRLKKVLRINNRTRFHSLFTF